MGSRRLCKAYNASRRDVIVEEKKVNDVGMMVMKKVYVKMQESDNKLCASV